MDPQRRYWFPVIGFNYRMTNLAAAIGVAQMEKIESALAFRKKLAAWYNEAFCDDSRIICPYVAPSVSHSFWMYSIMLAGKHAAERDSLMAYLAQVGIETRPVFYPMHVMPPYAEAETLFPESIRCAASGINLPTHELLEKTDIERISMAVREGLTLLAK